MYFSLFFLFKCLFKHYLAYLPVWQKLEEENREFFRAYYLRLMVKQQIIEYNRLLEQQARLMHQLHSTGVSSIPTSNGSHIPSSKNTFILDEFFCPSCCLVYISGNKLLYECPSANLSMFNCLLPKRLSSLFMVVV